ncbi:MAG TPA: hypothetical protein VFE47_28330 [Tepidisphaeraceae bacterium]|jgi:hypothetical protein|nr:hypothetical protein [Tepidisphaeraceae bacterium]
MNYIKIMLTLLVAATAALAIVMRPAPARTAAAQVIPPSRLDEALDLRIRSLEIKDLPAEAAVRIMEEKTGIDIFVDWNSFEKTAGGWGAQYPFPRAEHVTFSLSNATLREAITCLFNCNKNRPFFTRGIGNRIEVLDAAVPGQGLRSEMYDVSDLLSDDYWHISTPKGREDEIRKERMGDLISMLYSCGWVNGLDTGATPLANRIMVIDSDIGHQRLRQILTWLRRMR